MLLRNLSRNWRIRTMDEDMEIMEEAVVRDVIKLIKQYHIEKVKELEAVEIEGDEDYDNKIWDIIDHNAYLIRYIKKHYGLDQDLTKT